MRVVELAWSGRRLITIKHLVCSIELDDGSGLNGGKLRLCLIVPGPAITLTSLGPVAAGTVIFTS